MPARNIDKYTLMYYSVVFNLNQQKSFLLEHK